MVRLAILTCVIFATVANAFLVTPFHTCTKSTKGKAIFSTTRQKQNLLATSASTSTSTTESDNDDNVEPQVLATGYSQSMDMKEAIQEATEMALEALPRYSKTSGPQKIDLAIVSVSSLYDGSYSPAEVVPAVLEAASAYGEGIQHLVGSTVGGMISSMANTMDGPESSMTRSKPENVLEDLDFDTDEEDDDDVDDYDDVVGPMTRACVPVEREGVPSVSVMLAILPDVNVETFHILDDDVPDDYGRTPSKLWKQSVGLSKVEGSSEKQKDGDGDDDDDSNTAFFLLPSPAFQNDLDNFLQGLEIHYPNSSIFGAIASTVSSLSRSRLFRYDAPKKTSNGENNSMIQTMGDGCVGVAMTGDIEIQTIIAQGAKPVGGVYQIVKGDESTISVVALDETATELIQTAEEEDGIGDDEEEDDDDDDDFDESATTKQKLAAAYAKARIPKPVLAEANFIMKNLSDDDQAFMRKALLVGLDRGGSIGRTPSELARLREGKGHRFTVHQVASAAMKDGSVTLSLGSVNVKPGTRMRFFVREAGFAKKEVEALWTGYKRRTLTESLKGDKKRPFEPTGCFVFPTLDRGSKFFLGKSGYEIETVSQFLPTVPCISGFFCNGVIGALQTDPELGTKESTALYGSASGYVLFGSKSGRPIYSPVQAAAAEEEKVKGGKKSDVEVDAEGQLAGEGEVGEGKSIKILEQGDERVLAAPRDERGELILKRREVHSGRALTVSTVEWSVAEKTATPTSALEGYMWDKETEVDRFRERVPLANLVSQCRLSNVDPSKPKPRDFVGPIKEAAAAAAATGKDFIIIPECKRIEPTSGSLRKRYDVSKLAKEYTLAGVPAISVNCDGVLFGGSLEDLTKAREASSKAALSIKRPSDKNNDDNDDDDNDDDGVVVPPILASDLLLYPYQLYKIRLAGADAVNLIVGALETKDLVYLTKIASSLQMQSLLSVTSTAQIENLSKVLSKGSVDALIISNRNLEDFSFDMTGRQVIDILQSNELEEFKQIHGNDVPILVEGRIGIIKSKKMNTKLTTTLEEEEEEDEDENSTTSSSPSSSSSSVATELNYIEELKLAGAMGAIVGGGIVPDGFVSGDVPPVQTLLGGPVRMTNSSTST